MSDDAKDNLILISEPERSRRNQPEPIALGSWWWVKSPEEDYTPWLGSVIHVGSNYVLLHGPVSKNRYHSERIHLDRFDETCTPEPKAQEFINEKIAEQREAINQAMRQIQEISSRLAIGPSEADSETRALAVYDATSMDEYKRDLVTAKDKSLPELFSSIEESAEIMKVWMSSNLLPIEANSRRLKESKTAIESRLFGVELYAGLIEQAVRIADGTPAAPTESVHLFQRRHYMDEECLANYETGGMRFEQLEDFERWLLTPTNLSRILPYPRCMIAFRVRRTERERTLNEFVNLMFEGDYDMKTFLYMRNGERVYRLSTGIEFGENLFPDTDHSTLKKGTLYGILDFDQVKRLATEGEYQELLREEDRIKTLPREDQWRHRVEHPSDKWHLWHQSSVYYDDITAFVKKQMEEHNRLVLVLQGIFDRSEIFHPHPTYKLWSPVDFVRAISLVHDTSRALSAGDKPDFEVYRDIANRHLHKGAHTVGQNDFWQRRMAEKENERREHEYRHSDRYNEPLKRFKPRHNPGPAIVAEIERFSPTKGCTFSWSRKKRSRSYFVDDWPEGEVESHITVPASELLCVEGYKPGDYHRFYDDPRTRAEYIQWAPLLLRAEDWHAGKLPKTNDED